MYIIFIYGFFNHVSKGFVTIAVFVLFAFAALLDVLCFLLTLIE